MGRIRSVHPEQWTDEGFVSCSPHARLLALAVRNDADDNGVFAWRPLQLKMRLLPVDDVDVEALLDELAAAKQIRKFEANGAAYGQIRNFTRFQRPQRPTFASPVPADAPPGYTLHSKYAGQIQRVIAEDSASDRGVIAEDSASDRGVLRPEGRGGESRVEKRREEESAEPEAGLSLTAENDTYLEFVIAGGATWVLTAEKALEYFEAYPHINVDGELRKAAQWAVDNPGKRKTARGMPKYLNAWLARADSGGRTGGARGGTAKDQGNLADLDVFGD